MAPRIAVIGAGPAGCMLARLLHQGGIDVVVYEGEASPDDRWQGGTLDLHGDTGLAAIKEAGLWEAFGARARYDGEYMLVCDKNLGTYYFKTGAAPSEKHGVLGERPEIDRSALRQMLAESLPADMIRWGKRVRTVEGGAEVLGGGSGGGGGGGGGEAAPADPPVVTFADGTTATGFDLVVGADGAWSKVRAALSDQQPLFSGMVQQEMRVPDAATATAAAAAALSALSALVHGGSVLAQADGGRSLAVQQMGDGALSVSVYLRRSDVPNVPLDETGKMVKTDNADSVDSADSVDRSHSRWTEAEAVGYDPRDLAAVQHAMLTRADLLADFDPRLQAAVSAARGATALRALYALPVGFRWTHRPGLTAIGDAAHLMTPFAGEGVNVALDDARRLAAAILVAAGVGLDKARQNPDANPVSAPNRNASSNANSANTNANPNANPNPARALRALDAAVHAFETDMFARAGRVARLTDDIMRMWYYTPGAPDAVVATVMARHARFYTPLLLQPLATAAVHAHYFLHKKCLKKDMRID